VRTAAAAIVPAREHLLEVYEISPAVNRADNDSAALIEPISAGAGAAEPTPEPVAPKRKTQVKKDDGQASLF